MPEEDLREELKLSDKNKKTLQKVITWGWNLIVIYLIVFSIFVYQFDAKQNRDLYSLVSYEDKERAFQDYERDPIRFPEEDKWMLTASTIEECKPMAHMTEMYHTYLSPIAAIMLGLIVMKILLTFQEKKKKE